MIKRIYVVFAMLLTILLFSIPSAFADKTVINPQTTFLLPLSLQEIEEEVFSDTAAQIVIFPDGLVCIGENAFSGARKLTDVFIPERTKLIADSAFSLNSNLVIHGIKGSYAEDWAGKHRIPFVEENIWKLVLDHGKTGSFHILGIDFFYNTVNPRSINKAVPRAEDENESKRPQDRPELNPIDYRFP